MKETYKRSELEIIEFTDYDILVESPPVPGDDEVDIRGHINLF